VRKPNSGVELDQSGSLCGPRRLAGDSETLGGTPQKRHVAQRLGRRRQQQKLGVARERLDTLEECLLDATRQRPRVGEAKPTGQLRRRQSARELD
jgi:hypothetical protein